MADLLPCPFCGSAAKISGGNLRWWVSCTRLGVCIANRPDVAAYSCENKADATRLWNTRHDHTADLVEVLEKADKFITDFYAPWGSWKTEWWEGEVSDDAAFSHDNALKHVANILRAALSRARNTPDLVGEK